MTSVIATDKKYNYKWVGILILLLFFIAPYIQSDANDSTQTRYLTLIPPIVSKFASLVRWMIIGILFLTAIFNYTHFKKFQNKHITLFALFYFFPMLFAVFNWSDAPRYISLFVLAGAIPLVVASQFKDEDGFFNFKYLQIIILVNVLASILVSYRMIFFGNRFQGILSNPNMYGITAVFWFTLLQINPKKSKYTLILSLVTLITIILSGSRAATGAAFVVLFFSYYKHLKKLILLGILFIIFAYVINLFIDLSFILDRFDNLGNSAKDSGRQQIWNNAFKYIDRNALGHGMNSPMELLGTGNVHNNYVRFLLTMGYPFTVITISILFLHLVIAYLDKKVPKPLIGFFLGYIVANFAEDFFVGLGSSIFIYVSMLIGFFSYYHAQNNSIKSKI